MCLPMTYCSTILILSLFFFCSLFVSCFAWHNFISLLPKGYLENTEKDRIRRLIRLKPPSEFWNQTRPFEAPVVWSLISVGCGRTLKFSHLHISSILQQLSCVSKIEVEMAMLDFLDKWGSELHYCVNVLNLRVAKWIFSSVSFVFRGNW